MKTCSILIDQGATFYLCLFVTWISLLQGVGAQDSPQNTHSKKTASEQIPAALRKRITDLRTRFESLSRPHDAEIATTEKEVEGLARELKAGSFPIAAGDLFLDWSEVLQNRHARNVDAIRNLNRALAVYRDQKTKDKIALALTNRSAMRITASEFGSAWTDLEEAGEIVRETRNQEQEARILSNRAIVMIVRSQFKQALAALDKAEEFFSGVADHNQLAIIYGNRAHLLNFQKKPGEALPHFEAAISSFKKAGNETGRAKMMYSLAKALSQMRRLNEAADTYKIAAEIFSRLGIYSHQADSLINCGADLLEIGKISQAIALFRQVEKLALEQNDVPRAAIATLNLGAAFEGISELENSLAALARAKKHYSSLSDKEGLADVAMNRGNVLQRQNQLAEARKAYEFARTIHVQLGNKLKVAQIASNIANLYLTAGAFDKAIKEIEAVLHHGDHDEIKMQANPFVTLGNAYRGLFEIDKALAAFGKAERIALANGNQSTRAHALLNRGAALEEVARYQEALVDLAKGEALFTQMGNKAEAAKALAMRGNVYRSLSRYEEALDAYKVADERFRGAGQSRSRGVTFLNLGVTLGLLGENEKCLKFMDKAEKIFLESSDELNLANVVATRALTNFELERYEEALLSYSRAEKMYRSIGSLNYLANVVLNRGNVYLAMQKYESALQNFDRALSMFQDIGSRTGLMFVAFNRGAVLGMMGEYNKANSSFALGLDNLESLLQQGEKGLGELSSRGIRKTNMMAPHNCAALSLLMEEQGIESGYDDCVRLAFRALEVVQGRSLLERLGQSRIDLDSSGLSDEKRDQFRSLQVERRNALAGRERLLRAPMVSQEKLRAVNARLERIDSRQQQIIELAEALIPVRTKAALPKASTIEEVQQWLPRSTALIQFAHNERTAFAFLIKKDYYDLVSLGSPDSLRKDLGLVGHNLREAATLLDRTALRRFSKRILDPVMASLNKSEFKTSSLVVSLKGELARIPIEVLLTRDSPPKTNLADLPFLINEFDVTYVPSATSFVAMRKQAELRASEEGPERIDFYGLGMPLDVYAEAEEEGRDRADVEAGDLDPVLTRGSLTRGILFGSKDEVLGISSLFANENEKALIEKVGEKIEDLELSESARISGVEGDRFKVLLRGGASESRFKNDEKLKWARFVHFAGHGEADLTSPALSRLVLAQSDRLNGKTGDDGYLYFRELSALDLHAELLTLSACSTNDGVLFPTEGIMGLAQGGLLAGAESVLSTLWRIDDEDAQELMVNFYQRLIKKDQTRGRALAEAKRQAIKKEIPVATWAAYILWDAQVGGE